MAHNYIHREISIDGQVVDREFNAQELADIQDLHNEHLADEALRLSKLAAKKAILEKLGLTADEMEVFLS